MAIYDFFFQVQHSQDLNLQENVVMDIKNQKELFDTKEEHEEGRMIMDITDYPPTGPNHSHTPKSPGKPGN